MQTTHQFILGDARDLSLIENEQVQLVVTSPPYPMIAMWDDTFRQMSSEAGEALDREAGLEAFEAMHMELDRTWRECFRVLSAGGFACINIGDATRSLGGDFRLFHNHARIITAMSKIGFHVLPDILWRKPTNAPNKFMGSGMLPAGAYVTYEHEYILVFRKGSKRLFQSQAQKTNRSQSAFFWEERNIWFSDVWEGLTGTRQALTGPRPRERSAAFPMDLPYRLIHMYSTYGDVVLDPFVGTGTTLAAAVAAGRSSLGVEISAELATNLSSSVQKGVEEGPSLAEARLNAHRAFVQQRLENDKPLKYQNGPHDLPVMTRQEQRLCLQVPTAHQEVSDRKFVVQHKPVATDKHPMQTPNTTNYQPTQTGEEPAMAQPPLS